MTVEKELIIAGAGASGLMAGIMAGRNGLPCLFLEHEEAAGKKLLATGNGRCNFTNEDQKISFYNTKNQDFVKKVFSVFSKDMLVSFFREIGIRTFSRDGYYYPHSGQASTIRNLLVLENERLGNTFSFNEHIKGISIEGEDGIYIKTENNEYRCQKLIVAAGARAQEKLGSDGSLAGILEGLGYEFSPFTPALVPLLWDCPYSNLLSGIRAKGEIFLFSDEIPFAASLGELQFTDYGISGIPVFQVSRFFTPDKNIRAVIDFFPNDEEEELYSELLSQTERYGEKAYTVGDMVRLLQGFGNDKLMLTLVVKYLNDMKLIKEHNAKQKGSRLIKEYMGQSFKWDLDALSKSLAKSLKEFEAGVTGTRGFDYAQVCAGGIELSQLSPETMESKMHKGLYITGEILDVDGCCGGYNLQWAFSTGYVAGKAAGLSAKNKSN